MSRSGYSEDGGDYAELYRATVDRAIGGKRGQAFLRELASAMDAMPEKRLIAHELISEQGQMCTIGVVCAARGLDVTNVNADNADSVGGLVGIARSMAAEIEYENDECGRDDETPEHRWTRMRKWVSDSLRKAGGADV